MGQPRSAGDPTAYIRSFKWSSKTLIKGEQACRTARQTRQAKPGLPTPPFALEVSTGLLYISISFLLASISLLQVSIGFRVGFYYTQVPK